MLRGAAGSRRRWAPALIVALSCLGLLSLTAFSPRAGARRAPVSRVVASSCSNGGGTSGIFLYGGDEKLVSETDLPVCVTGHLTVTFAGDPASGCSSNGLCGYSGTETWTPENFGDMTISTFKRHGRRYRAATLLLGGPGSPVRSAVQHVQATGATTACSDSSQGGDGFFSVPVRGARVTVGLDHSDTPLLGTRCAGPLAADMAAALPSRTVNVNAILRGGVTIDLTGGGTFAAHGLAGTVRSTLVLVVGRPHRSSGARPGSPPPGLTRSRLINVTYRITHVGGGATASVSSSALTAVCGPFDACGLQGTIDVMPGSASGGSVFLTAVAPISRPKRDLLAALGAAGAGNPSGIRLLGGGQASTHGTVTADLTQAGACRDQVELAHTQIQLHRRADRLEISVSPGTSQAADPLRTRCPGPELGSRQLTSGSVPLSALRHRSFTVALRGGSFSDGPYRVTTQSTLSLTLRRAGIKMQIVPFVARAG